MLLVNVSNLLSGNRHRDYNCNQGQHTASQEELQAGDVILPFEGRLKFHEDKLALWLKFFYLLVFKEDGLSALVHSLLSTFCKKKSGLVPWADVTNRQSHKERGCSAFFEGKSAYN